jgi:hypothetical protein
MDREQAVLLLVVKFILPLSGTVNDYRSIASPYLTKLIALINTKPLHDFLKDLH